MKPILVSGVQPSGRMHIGNYLGALKNFVDLQNSGKYRCFYFLADLHSFTTAKDPFDAKQKEREIIELASDFLAVGVDPKKSTLYLQSLIPAHSELAWIFSTITPIGELRRMTQFKDKADSSGLEGRIRELSNYLEKAAADSRYNKKLIGMTLKSAQTAFSEEQENANAGLFIYPTLMAADILLYDPKFVPVGDDQKQHLELTRTIARKFNARFGKTFIEPQALFTPTPRVMSLADPTKKMSKSVPESCLFLDDEPETIKTKVMRAVTDSETTIRYDWEKKPGISNLLDIFCGLTGEAVPSIEKRFADKNYGEFKKELAGVIADHFADFRKRKKTLLAKPKSLVAVLKAGSKKASRVADKKMAEVKRKVGIAL